jgi:serine/threonine-protein kinase
MLAARRDRVKARLADSVAALETIRLDLLRLHSNANDLAPLTTLMNAALVVAEDVSLLADASREVEDVIARRATRLLP